MLVMKHRSHERPLLFRFGFMNQPHERLADPSDLVTRLNIVVI